MKRADALTLSLRDGRTDENFRVMYTVIRKAPCVYGGAAF